MIGFQSEGGDCHKTAAHQIRPLAKHAETVAGIHKTHAHPAQGIRNKFDNDLPDPPGRGKWTNGKHIHGLNGVLGYKHQAQQGKCIGDYQG